MPFNDPPVATYLPGCCKSIEREIYAAKQVLLCLLLDRLDVPELRSLPATRLAGRGGSDVDMFLRFAMPYDYSKTNSWVES